MTNILGEHFTLTSFGESHGKCVGVIVNGCPAGLRLKESEIQKELDKRKPGTSILVTQRKESDTVEIMSGVFEGYTTGAPICMIVQNKDADSSTYEKFKNIPRPGHSDYTGKKRFGGYNDWRGGGIFSARTTVSLVMAGAIAKKLLSTMLNIDIFAYTLEIGGIRAKIKSYEYAKKHRYKNLIRCPDSISSKKMEEKIKQVRSEGDSVGGIIECIATNVPPGLGSPNYNSLDGSLSAAMHTVPAVKGVEIGIGFNASRMKGSENNDSFILNNGKIITETNNSGGILGGITTGMPIVIRVGLKPASSISKEQNTLNLIKKTQTKLIVKGRHDPCVVPRAIPIIESATAVTLLDHVLKQSLIPTVINKRF